MGDVAEGSKTPASHRGGQFPVPEEQVAGRGAECKAEPPGGQEFSLPVNKISREEKSEGKGCTQLHCHALSLYNQYVGGGSAPAIPRAWVSFQGSACKRPNDMRSMIERTKTL